jgi:hypothetical protein
LGLVGVSDSGNGVTCILLLVEIEGFVVGQDAEAAVALDVLFSFLDATFFFRDLLALLPLFPPHCDSSSSESKKVSLVYCSISLKFDCYRESKT